MVQVIWTRRALSDLAALRAYIGQFSPLAAQRMAIRLKRAGDSLGEHPERTRSIGPSLREFTAIPPYILRYQVTLEAVVIIRIRHGAQQVD
ncbi:type II toxin-antitoxin system RelE/ParE family toxin [Caulobacter sp. DWP3-1-3b2]|uniref:type II toxin-antitoxin system RelE/ParE family toxin n=1 Tax=Caulobacter sp. DWP3-1-3b2 TaxID=2804643 RepID=UPI003CE947EF